MASAYNENYYDITPQIQTLAQLCTQAGAIDPALYGQHQVKRGLRDLDGKGVLTGLTEIAEIQSSREENGVSVPCEGRLFYRGISINDIVRGFLRENRYGFEETAYLLLFGDLPTREQLEEFQELLAGYRTLPTNFVRDIIMKAPQRGYDEYVSPERTHPVLLRSPGRCGDHRECAAAVPAAYRPVPAAGGVWLPGLQSLS